MDAQKPKDAPRGQAHHQRKLRNYLLDKRFQLKYTGIVIAITALLSAVLGYHLHREIVVSQRTILARDLAADTIIIPPGDVEKRQEVSQRIDQEFNDALQTKLAVVVKLNNAPAGETAQLYEEAFEQERQRATSMLVFSLLAFLGILAIVWVYLTHKIAGPVYKLRLLFSKVSGDHLVVRGRLRKGDELQDAFRSFMEMIDRLRDDRREKAERLRKAIEQLREKKGDANEAIAMIEAVQKEMMASLEE